MRCRRSIDPWGRPYLQRAIVIMATSPHTFKTFFDACRTAVRTLKEQPHAIQKDLARRAALRQQRGEGADGATAPLGREAYVRWLRLQVGAKDQSKAAGSGGSSYSSSRRR